VPLGPSLSSSLIPPTLSPRPSCPWPPPPSEASPPSPRNRRPRRYEAEFFRTAARVSAQAHTPSLRAISPLQHPYPPRYNTSTGAQPGKGARKEKIHARQWAHRFRFALRRKSANQQAPNQKLAKRHKIAQIERHLRKKETLHKASIDKRHTKTSETLSGKWTDQVVDSLHHLVRI
jgi:hypothetical protein